MVGTAIAALGHLVFMGDAEGSILRWDTNTGRASVMPTGVLVSSLCELCADAPQLPPLSQVQLRRWLCATPCMNSIPAKVTSLHVNNNNNHHAAFAGYGAVRRIQLAPPASPHLYSTPDAVLEAHTRLAVLFSNGAFGVWEVESAGGRLRPGHASPNTYARAGRLLDLAWLPLPRCVVLMHQAFNAQSLVDLQ